MTEQRKGKLLAADPSIMKDGTHYSKVNSFTDKDGQTHENLYYYFDLTWDNGDKGSAKAKTTQGSFKIGDEYSYEKGSFTTKTGTIIYFFNKLNNLSYSQSHGGGRTQVSPDQQKQIMNQVAFIAANSCRDTVSGEYLDIYNAFRSWLYTKVIDEKEDSKSASGVLKITAGFYEKEPKGTTLDKVLKLADYYLDKTKETSWKEASQTNTQSYSPNQGIPQQQTLPLNQKPGGMNLNQPEIPEDDDMPF